ncbi:MAG: nucleotide sugar dehydrogenase [Gemmatimonadota bacterium]
MSQELVERFRRDDLTFGVIGLGYVGLPLAVEAARSGMKVLGFDVQERVTKGINDGLSHIQDLTHEEIREQVEAGRLEATTDMGRLAECGAISICVPTPLSKTRDPDISFIFSATEAVSKTLTPGQLVVLESTTYPGTTREIVLPELEKKGLVVGEDFYLCFSPERVDPGNLVWMTKNTPKVIGGVTPACSEAGAALYSRFFDALVPVSSTEAAELTKILENTFRAVNIGLVNEVALIADRLGVDVWEVIDAAATKPFGFMKFTPGPGLGGHCIPVDPHYLSWKMRTMNYKTRFIDVASEINSAMPEFVVGKVWEALNRAGKAVNGSRVLVLGVAYKPDIDDVRESPALDVIRLLEGDGATVDYHDPYVPLLEEDGRRWEGKALTDELLSSVDVAVIVTNHSNVDHARVFELAPIVVDTRNATKGLASSRSDGVQDSWIVKGPRV